MMIDLLNKNGLLDEIEQITNRFYNTLLSRNKHLRLLQFARWGSEMITVYSYWLKQYAARNEDDVYGLAILQLLRNLTTEAIMHLKLHPNDNFSIINEIIELEPDNSMWKSLILNILIETIRIIKVENEDNKNINTLFIKATPDTFFSWNRWTEDKNKKLTLVLFLNDLSALFPGLNARMKLERLFAVNASDYRIALPSKYLLAFLMIFNELHKSKRISCENNRGLFMHLQEHLTALLSDKFPLCKNYSKMFHEQMKNSTKKNKVLALTRPIISKYTNNLPLLFSLN